MVLSARLAKYHSGLRQGVIKAVRAVPAYTALGAGAAAYFYPLKASLYALAPELISGNPALNFSGGLAPTMITGAALGWAASRALAKRSRGTVPSPEAATAIAPSPPGILLKGDNGIYRLGGEIGRGGMGVVYRATDEKGEKVCIKILNSALLASDEIKRDTLRRLANEFKSITAINSPYVVRGIDMGTKDDGSPFIVMEYLEGKTLAELIEERHRHHGRLLPEEATAYLIQIIRGLEAAAEKDVAHRDLKPENIFLTAADKRDPAKLTAVILDFGLAKIVREDMTTDEQTRTGVLAGTYDYLPPDDLEFSLLTKHDRKKLSPEALQTWLTQMDIYSLGCILYKSLTGSVPFPANDPSGYVRYARGHDKHTLENPGNVIPQKLFEVVGKMLAFNRHERYSSYAELTRELTAANEPAPKPAGGPPVGDSTLARALATQHAGFGQQVGTGGLPSAIRGGLPSSGAFSAAFSPFAQSELEQLVSRLKGAEQIDVLQGIAEFSLARAFLLSPDESHDLETEVRAVSTAARKAGDRDLYKLAEQAINALRANRPV